jgi:hypothetical protein
MANSLWFGVAQAGLAVNRPTVWELPEQTFGFYLAVDTGDISVWNGSGWVELSGIMGNAILANLPTADPEVAGDLWNDNGVLAVSAGA